MIQLFGYSFTDESMDDVLQVIAQSVSGPRFYYLSTLNPEMIVRAQSDPVLSNHFKTSLRCVADGTGLVWASQWLLGKRLPKITGIGLVRRLFSDGQLRIFLLGAKPEVLQKCLSAIPAQFPLAKITGSHHGYFDPAMLSDIAQQIQSSEADVVLVAMGCPIQERMLSRLAELLPRGVGIGVGGVLDVFSGTIPAAPAWTSRLGLEWIYRGLQDPKRMKRWGFIPRFLRMCLRGD